MPSSTVSSRSARILLVDDNEAMLARVAAVLTPSYVVVGQVREGRAALDAAIALRPDVIVLDISMPGMSGLEIATCLRQAGSTAALVFLTVHEEEEIVLAARAAGAMAYVVKPRMISDLMLAVGEALAGRQFVSRIR